MSITDNLIEIVHDEMTAQNVSKDLAPGIKSKEDEPDKANSNNENIDTAIQNQHTQAQNESLSDRANQALENRESIQHELPEISNLILRNGSKFDNAQTGDLVYKDGDKAIVQIGKNIGLSYDAENFKNIELGERVTIFMVHDEHRIMAAAEYERQQQGHDVPGADRAVELENEMH
ncbi:hypothetical protein [Moraxella catarrhalis]|uniref:Uncharacterized protein n=1 Tax=Moraxella catarrhalis TaxID=480 RepID=A0A198UN78_MORCA|nr:hypothetical protein [Moraxella catarrhalis]OAU96697.1 hypothetical protein AO384_0858 [Moraxella catarrhalis]OAU98120.1 hypothetical protein AO383_0789 [Moraxella catarrhalis]OAV04698.1 hypothetical protein AO385_0018 [Moraxella catarrhalis]